MDLGGPRTCVADLGQEEQEGAHLGGGNVLLLFQADLLLSERHRGALGHATVHGHCLACIGFLPVTK